MKKYVSSKHLEAISDLTLVAPIKQGFIDAFEAVTYETRLRKLLEALFKIRSTAREHTKIKPFVDTAERIQSLLDYRLAVLDTEPRQLMLSATFDRPFEPYMRLIWDPLGPLLDVIFCNCEGYVTATGHSFEEYLAWVRSAQIDTDFFYAASGHSVSDMKYLLKVERREREEPWRSSTLVYLTSPEEEAREVRTNYRKESNLLGTEALVSLYRLTDFYPPDHPGGDGNLLLAATRQLLRGWGCDLDPAAERLLIPEQLHWFWGGDKSKWCQGEGREPPARMSDEEKQKERDRENEKRTKEERLQFQPKDIQGGILSGYGTDEDPVRFGALLLMRITDAEKARNFIGQLEIADGSADGTTKGGGVFRNIAFTRRGLANIGVAASELDRFPQEFHEGMEERAGLLGDIRDSHPRRWSLPDRNGPDVRRDDAPRTPVEMSEIDFVIQLRTTGTIKAGEVDDDDIGKAAHPLHADVWTLALQATESGVQLLAVQPMRRADPEPGPCGREHFGYADGFSQPRLPADGLTPDRRKDEVATGELFLGYSNDRSDPPSAVSTILDNGTFLVVRKLRQHVGAMRALVKEVAEKEKVEEEFIYGKLMGRRRDGIPMLHGLSSDDNLFGYERDEYGLECPFQAHIRRTNPRGRREGDRRRPTPRILRRGLSYGTGLPEGEEDIGERGVIFMAYNASIAEQFEVIQRWVNGANSSGVASWQSDPLMGVPQDDDPRTFRFRFKAKRSATDNGKPKYEFREIPITLPKAFVELQWGMYLFVPSMAAIRAIVERPEVALQASELAEKVDAERGDTIIARLLKQAASDRDGRRAAAAGWKTCLEDFNSKDPAEKAEAAAIWAAIRLRHGGALRVPYGIVEPGGLPEEVVLVASKELVMRVFSDPNGDYSMSGQMKRMKQSFGEIFLGMDDGDEYQVKSRANGPIFAILEEDAFKVAWNAANLRLGLVFALVADMFEGKPELDLRRDFITPVLAGICHEWFGIPDTLQTFPPPAGNFVDPLGWSWDPSDKPRCPGDFMATSRYCFYPDPVPRVQAYGQAQGQGLRAAVRSYFDAKRKPGQTLKGNLTDQIANLRLENGDLVYPDNDELARTVIGVMTGFLPPADGCMRWALYEWLESKTLWRIQQDLAAHPSKNPYERASKALRPWLERAMQKRPAPDLLWRTATRDHQLGDVAVAKEEKVFVAIVSALAEDAAAGITDVYPVFGGNRQVGDSTAVPLHACPAYKAAMGTMLGMLSALLESARFEALPAPLLVQLSNPSATIQGVVALPQIAGLAAQTLAAASAPAPGSTAPPGG